MKTPEFYLDEVAFEHVVVHSFSYALHSFSREREYQSTIEKIVKEAIKRYAEDACKEQKIIIANTAKIFFNEDTAEVDKDSILNALTPKFEN